MRGIDYENHYPPNLKSIPPAKYLKSWGEDYKKMQSTMIHGESPSFNDLISYVESELSDYNDLVIEPNET